MHQFYVINASMIKQMLFVLRRFLVPLYNAFSIKVLMSPSEHFSFTLQLKNPLLMNVTAIAKNIDFHTHELLEVMDMEDLHQMSILYQMISAQLFISNKLPKFKKNNQMWFYHMASHESYHELMLNDNSSSLLQKRFKIRKPGSRTEGIHVIDNYNKLKNTTPDYLRYLQIKLTYNALPTVHLLKMACHDGSVSCHLCTSSEFPLQIIDTIEYRVDGLQRVPHCRMLYIIRDNIATLPVCSFLSNLQFHHHLLIADLSHEDVQIIIAYNFAMCMMPIWLVSKECMPKYISIHNSLKNKFTSKLPAARKLRKKEKLIAIQSNIVKNRMAGKDYKLRIRMYYRK